MSRIKKPLITIILVVRNAADTINIAIDSVLKQPYQNKKLIIIDGASTDGTLDILHAYRESIDTLVSEPDSGAAEAINKGLKIAKGELIATLFADDFYEQDIFTLVANQYLKTPDADIISTGCRVITATPTPQIITEQRYTPLSMQRFINSQPFVGCRFFNSKIFNKGSYFQSHDKNNDYNYANDTTFLMHLFLSKHKEVIVPSIGYTYISSPNSTTYAGNPDISIRCYVEEIRTVNLELLTGKNLNLFDRFWLKVMKQDRALRLYRLQKSQNNRLETSRYKQILFKKPILSCIALAYLLFQAIKKRLIGIPNKPLSAQLLHSIDSLLKKNRNKPEECH